MAEEDAPLDPQVIKSVAKLADLLRRCQKTDNLFFHIYSIVQGWFPSADEQLSPVPLLASLPPDIHSPVALCQPHFRAGQGEIHMFFSVLRKETPSLSFVDFWLELIFNVVNILLQPGYVWPRQVRVLHFDTSLVC